MAQFTPFDAADYLDSEEAIAAYLAAALQDESPELLRAAVKDVLRALDVRLHPGSDDENPEWTEAEVRRAQRFSQLPEALRAKLRDVARGRALGPTRR